METSIQNQFGVKLATISQNSKIPAILKVYDVIHPSAMIREVTGRAGSMAYRLRASLYLFGIEAKVN